jgi:hypothetical protein
VLRLNPEKRDETKIYIHIGLHKTGSTFLQKRLFPALPVNLITGVDIKYISDSEQFVPEVFLELIEKRKKSAEFADTVISQEGFSGSSDGNPARDPFRIAERLKAVFDDAKIIIVTRKPDDYIRSLYAFRVTARGLETRTFDEYMNDKKEQLKRKLDTAPLIEKYRRLFGKNAVLALEYETLKDSPEKFTTEILDFMNTQPVREIVYIVENKGIKSEKIIEFHRKMNSLALPVIRFLKKLKLAKKGHSWPEKLYFAIKKYLVNKFFV